MRLINTATLAIDEFYDAETPEYMILSHRWEALQDEPSHADYIADRKTTTIGHAKVLSFCKLAREKGFGYCWIGTCCIDKTSSAELSEAINSMFRWYRNAGACCAYLRDVDKLPDLEKSEWFRRGWTLQELLAPKGVLFYNRNWDLLGSRSNLSHTIAGPSGIHEPCLAGYKAFDTYSIAKSMSWASHRKTSRVEDEAYCLLGLFGVHLPLLYGEGYDLSGACKKRYWQTRRLFAACLKPRIVVPLNRRTW